MFKLTMMAIFLFCFSNNISHAKSENFTGEFLLQSSGMYYGDLNDKDVTAQIRINNRSGNGSKALISSTNVEFTYEDDTISSIKWQSDLPPGSNKFFYSKFSDKFVKKLQVTVTFRKTPESPLETVSVSFDAKESQRLDRIELDFTKMWDTADHAEMGFLRVVKPADTANRLCGIHLFRCVKDNSFGFASGSCKESEKIDDFTPGTDITVPAGDYLVDYCDTYMRAQVEAGKKQLLALSRYVPTHSGAVSFKIIHDFRDMAERRLLLYIAWWLHRSGSYWQNMFDLDPNIAQAFHDSPNALNGVYYDFNPAIGVGVIRYAGKTQVETSPSDFGHPRIRTEPPQLWRESLGWSFHIGEGADDDVAMGPVALFPGTYTLIFRNKRGNESVQHSVVVK